MFGWAEKLFTGVDLDEEQKRSDELDKKLLEQNQAALNRGVYTQDQFDASNAAIAEGHQDVYAEVGGAFNEGLKEGVDNVRNGIGNIATFPLKLISWKLWVIGAIAIFFYMGGGVYLKGILPRKLK